MIQYALKCDQDHRFDSWFQSAEAFDKLQSSRLVTCALCGSAKVEKAIMAPRVASGQASPETTDRAVAHQGALSQPSNAAEQALSELKRTIEENSEYVGDSFVSEARAIHNGDAPERAIYGEAKPEDAKKLVEDGVPVAPLPFRPGRKSN